MPASTAADGLGPALVGDLDVGLGEEDAAGVGVLDAVEGPPQHPERRRDDAAGLPRVDPLGQDVDPQPGLDQAPQRGAEPQPPVVGRPRVEAHDQRRRADALGQVVDVGREVGAARLLAGLDQQHAAGVAAARGPHRLDGGQRGEGGVPVVGAAPAVEAVALQHRVPRAEPLAPAVHRRLLVEVAVEQHRVGGGVARLAARCGHLGPDQRGPPLESDDLDLEPGQRPGRHPRRHQIGGPVHVAGLGPAGVVLRADVGDADVVGEGGDDLVVPRHVDEGGRRGRGRRPRPEHAVSPSPARRTSPPSPPGLGLGTVGVDGRDIGGGGRGRRGRGRPRVRPAVGGRRDRGGRAPPGRRVGVPAGRRPARRARRRAGCGRRPLDPRAGRHHRRRAVGLARPRHPRPGRSAARGAPAVGAVGRRRTGVAGRSRSTPATPSATGPTPPPACAWPRSRPRATSDPGCRCSTSAAAAGSCRSRPPSSAPGRVVAVDVAEDAVEVTRANAARNGVDGQVDVRLVDPVPAPEALRRRSRRGGGST